MREHERIVHELAAPQHGAVSRTQLRARGVAARQLHPLIQRGVVVPVTREVVTIAGSGPSRQRSAIAAVLDVPGRTALSHAASLAWWAVPGFDRQRTGLEVISTRPARTAISSLSHVHTTTLLPDSHVTILDGLWITVPVRAIFDLAGRLHPDRMARIVDAAWRQRLVTGRLLRRTLAELAEHGRSGIQTMRSIIEERGDDYRPPESNTEARFEKLMAEIGVVSFERQVDAGGIDWVGRVDFRDRHLPLVAEIDSATFHLSLTDRTDDLARREALEHAGFVVVSISDFDVWNRPRIVQEQVIEARRTALRR